MAASYSAFLSTKYYSPVFNTALFDGPFRIYFSQAYEGTALKIYHLLQVQHLEIWEHYKKWSEKTKKHIFVLVYPTMDDVELAFESEVKFQLDHLVSMKWDEGQLMAAANPKDEIQFERMYQQILQELLKLKLSDCTIETPQLAF
jgi:hypothetical protein